MLQISNINSYVKMQDAQNRIAAQKKQESSDQSDTKKASDSSGPDIGLMAISAKLKRGQRLSGGEMWYLRKKSPALYRKAQNIEDARCKLERQLRNCKSKQEVRALRMSVTQSAVLDGTNMQTDTGMSTETNTDTSTEDTGGIMYQAMDNEWTGFVRSKKYLKLPERRARGPKKHLEKLA